MRWASLGKAGKKRVKSFESNKRKESQRKSTERKEKEKGIVTMMVGE